ncbi:hypothetical protein DL98DRAFT_439884, partial [Cadophora sp. DSE1049]
IKLDLRTPVFIYKQLYVSVSQTSNVNSLSILLFIKNKSRTFNIVFPEVLINIR